MFYHVIDIAQDFFFADILIVDKAPFHQVFNCAQTPGYKKTAMPDTTQSSKARLQTAAS